MIGRRRSFRQTTIVVSVPVVRSRNFAANTDGERKGRTTDLTNTGQNHAS
jgi:hypothetical protein